MTNKCSDFFKKAVLVGLASIMPFGVFAGAKEDGVKAYKAKDYYTALDKFKEAQNSGELPKNNYWNSVISKLDNYVLQHPKKDDTFSNILLWSNVAALAGTAYFGTMSCIKANEYDKMYIDKDNTNEANYRILQDKKGEVEINNWGLAASGSLAAILTLYNVFDKNGWLNRNNVTAQVYDSKVKGPSLAINKEF